LVIDSLKDESRENFSAMRLLLLSLTFQTMEADFEMQLCNAKEEKEKELTALKNSVKINLKPHSLPASPRSMKQVWCFELIWFFASSKNNFLGGISKGIDGRFEQKCFATRTGLQSPAGEFRPS
jgi:hypothetical protein